MSKLMGKIEIEGIRQPVRIGCHVNERSYPQMLTFDIECKLDMTEAIKSDSLEQTIDYLAIVQALESFCREKEWQLVEKCAYDVGVELLQAFSRVEEVEIKLYKNVLVPAQGATIELTVKRENLSK